jgi:hypothetical protein
MVNGGGAASISWRFVSSQMGTGIVLADALFHQAHTQPCNIEIKVAIL